MTTCVEVTGLSPQDIKAMKQAEYVSFYHDRSGDRIRCRKEIKNHGPYDDRYREYEITVESYVRAYSDDEACWSRDVSETATCHEMLHSTSPEYTCWSAVCALVKPGDVLRLRWTANSCNGYMRKAATATSERIYHDVLALQIIRGDDRRILYTLEIDHSHCPDNSARMIRGYVLME